MSRFENELTGLDASLHDVYKSMEKVALKGNDVSISMVSAVRAFQAQTGKAKELASAYSQVNEISRNLADTIARHERVSLQLFLQYKKNMQGVKELSEEYKKLAAIQKVLDISSKSFADNLSGSISGLSKLSKGAIGLATSLTGLTLSHSKLTEILLDYNKTQYDSMRIGARYGDSLESHAAALDIVSKKTSFSKQEFEDLNLTIKEMTVGIPMTSKAVAELAESFSGKFGYSAERVKKAISELIPLQNKMPDLFDRIKKIQSEFSTDTNLATASTKSLRNEMRALGASQSDVDKVMNSVSRMTPDNVKMNEFEKSIATAKRDITDSALSISEDMEPALKAVAETQAMIAKSIALIHSGILIGVGAFAMIGAGAASLLTTVIGITQNIKMWGSLIRQATMGNAHTMLPPLTPGSTGAGATSMASRSAYVRGISSQAASYNASIGGGSMQNPSPLQLPRPMVSGQAGVYQMPSGFAPKSGGSGGSGMRVGASMGAIGLAAIAMIGPAIADSLDKRVTSTFKAKSANDSSLAISKASLGFMGGATKYGAMGMMVGGPYGALAGAAIGGGIGAYQGWKHGKQIARENFERQEEQKVKAAGEMSGVANNAGIKVKVGANKEQILDALKKETDGRKKNNALQEMFNNNQIKASEMQKIIAYGLTEITDSAERQKKAWDDTRKLIGDVVGGVKDELWVQNQIERSMAGQLTSLKEQLAIVDRIKEGGMASVSGLVEGNISHRTAEVGGMAATTASKDAAQIKYAQFARKFVMTASDDSELRNQFLPTGSLQVIEDAKKVASESGLKKTSAKTTRQIEMDRITGLDSSETSDGRKEELRALAEENYQKMITTIQQEVDRADKKVDDLIASIDPTTIIEAAKLGNEKYTKEYKNAVDSGTSTVAEKTAARAKVDVTGDLLANAEVELAQSEEKAYADATASSRKDLETIKSQTGLAEKKAAVASRMGQPQSYEAQKSLIDLAKKQYETAKQQQSESNATENQQLWERSGVNLDDVSLGDRKSMDAAVTQMISKNPTISRDDAEIRLNKALQERIRTSNEVVDAEMRLADTMKTWREGWMDAMDEAIIGAGDFAAVIGIGNKNVGEKNAAGGVPTFRYGSTNNRDMSTAEQFAVKNQEATRYTTQQGTTFGNSATQESGLNRFTGVLDDDAGNPAKAVTNAVNQSNNPVPIIPETTSQATQAFADAAAEEVINLNKKNATLNIPKSAQLATGDLINADVKENQPQGGKEQIGKIFSAMPNVLATSGDKTVRDEIGGIGKSGPKSQEESSVTTFVTVGFTPEAAQYFKQMGENTDNGTAL
jgi:hypothetical protein